MTFDEQHKINSRILQKIFQLQDDKRTKYVVFLDIRSIFKMELTSFLTDGITATKAK